MVVFRSKKALFYPNFTFANINTELRHNVPTPQRSNIVQERGRNLTLGQSTFCRPGGVPIKQCEITLFCIFMYIYEDFTDFCGVFFLRKSYQTIPMCQNSPKGQSAKRAKYYEQTSHNFNKTAVCSHRHRRGIFVQGYTFGCSTQVRATPQPSWASAPPLTTGSV